MGWQAALSHQALGPCRRPDRWALTGAGPAIYFIPRSRRTREPAVFGLLAFWAFGVLGFWGFGVWRLAFGATFQPKPEAERRCDFNLIE
jgi:hypothetical protein